jgi:glycosyltransferase involved in cell wall biosynthesis
MPPEPLVTVAMPAMNHERFIQQALDSILDGGMPSVEVIVCDDASSDGTPALAREWGRRHRDRLARFELIEHRTNAGLGASLNEIVRASRGETVHILASDDYFLPGGLAAKTQALLRHPEWEGAFSDARGVGHEGQLYQASLIAAGSLEPSRLTPSTMAEEVLYSWDTPANLLSWRRRAFKAFGGGLEYDSTVFCEDYDSVWWALSRRSLGFVPAICCAYRLRSWPQTSNRNPVREDRDVSYVLAKHARHFERPLRDAMLTFSEALFQNAIGDGEAARRALERHDRNRAAYLARLRQPVGATLPAAGASAPQPVDAASYDALLTELRQQREVVADQSTEIARLRARLEHHSHSPLRALGLWLNRKPSA